jgi:hypothetical protein
MGVWAPTKIRWVNETLGSSTGAARVETDLGPAYAKLLGNLEGPQALFCEWVGTMSLPRCRRQFLYAASPFQQSPLRLMLGTALRWASALR